MPATIGLFTTLPLVWGESEDLSGLLGAKAKPHWARTELERHGTLLPLDTLSSLGAGERIDLLVMAQPRPLSPPENVALDDWVRAGGHLLLFADPMLTADSLFPLGDRRRPQDTVLLSPILTRWGLALAFDEAQPPGERAVRLLDLSMPVHRPGRLDALPGGTCRTAAEGLVATCDVGKGRVTVIADAALLEEAEGSEALPRAAMLDRLIAQAKR